MIGGMKGGTGKSTIAINLAVMFKLSGMDTLLIDCDKQLTSLKFCNTRKSAGVQSNIISSHLSGDSLQVDIFDYCDKYDAVVIDSGGYDSVELRSAMLTPCLDLMIIPLKPGHIELNALVAMDRHVRNTLIYNRHLKAKCLFNQVIHNKFSTDLQESRDFINDDLENLSVMDTVLHHRLNYSRSMGHGKSVLEYEGEPRKNKCRKATDEMLNLYQEIMGEPFRNLLKNKELINV